MEHSLLVDNVYKKAIGFSNQIVAHFKAKSL